MFHARKLFLKALALLLLIGLLPFNARPVQGQGGITLEEYGALIDFGKTITFHAKIQTALPIQQVAILFQSANQAPPPYREIVQAAEDGSVSLTYDASSNVFPPFSDIVFWIEATLSDGQTYTSDQVKVRYDDTRFPWNQVTRANVTVHWYAGEGVMASKAHDMAALGMIKMKDLFPVSYDEPIHIYIYSNTEDLQSTLALGGKDWVGGHSIPEIGVALVAIPPEAGNPQFKTYEFETKIPHEVAHVLLYRAIGGKYAKQPRWLIEGIASMMEQYADPEYERALNLASQKNSLIPFTKLCDTFPLDTGSAYLAYAQSQSFVNYIYETHGKAGLTRLIDEYGDGVNCELGATRTLGIPLSQLDVRWRENILGQNTFGVAARNLSPFMLIMALVLLVPLWGMIDLLRQRKKREEKYAEKPRIK